MITLEVADLVLIASRTLGLDTGQVLDLLDPAAAVHALALVRPRPGPGDPADLAATLLRALVRERPLRRGNRPPRALSAGRRAVTRRPIHQHPAWSPRVTVLAVSRIRPPGPTTHISHRPI